MSVDYSAKLIIGVAEEDVVGSETTIRKVIRYNEMTGEKYEKNIKYSYTTLFGRKEEDVSKKLEDIGLDYINVDPLGAGEYYVGVVFYTDKTNVIEMEELQRVYNAVKSILTEQGYNGKVYIFNCLYCS